MDILNVSDLASTPAAPGYVAPRTPLEARLARTWAEILHTPRVGVHDDFFSLGGDSIRATEILVQVARIGGDTLPLSTLFQHSTVARLAAHLDHRAGAWSPLVPMQPQGTRPPFYCVHSLGGHVLWLRELAAQLAPMQPFYGLEALGWGGTEAPHRTIEAMAAYQIANIRAHQPEGPYYLGGYSGGGFVAYEMAQQLRAQGAQVGLLVLFDTAPPLPYRTPVSGLGLLARYHVRHSARNRLRHLDRRLSGARPTVEAPPREPDPYALATVVMNAFAGALRRYRARPYPGAVRLYQTAQMGGQVADGRPARWDWLLRGPFTVHAVAGTHLTMLQKPHVATLAQDLGQRLQEAQRAAAELSRPAPVVRAAGVPPLAS